MMMTERDLQIAEALSLRVQLMDLQQIASVWWSEDLNAAQRRLTTLVTAGLIDRTMANVCPRTIDCRLSWTAGDRTPDFEQVREQTRGRWQRPAQPTELFSASAVTLNLHGIERSHHTTIDERNRQMLLSDVFVASMTTRSMEASHWHIQSRCNMEESGQGRPDVLVTDTSGQPVRAISTVPRLVRRMEELHSYCVPRELPYELW